MDIYNCIFKVQTHFPHTYSELERYSQILPGNEHSPVHPFAGYVVNINVATRIHRDLQDQDICVVLVGSNDCEGGQLVLEEPGLVLDMQSGDIVIFPSHQISHFNMHFKGKRASIVLHSDQKGKEWVHDRNGWQHNTFMTC